MRYFEQLKITERKKSHIIKAYFEGLEEKIKKVVIDLFIQFRKVIRRILPKAEIIADKYVLCKTDRMDDKGYTNKIV